MFDLWLPFLILGCNMASIITKPFSQSDVTQERYTCPVQDGFYGLDGQCVPEYYICVGGEAYLQRCPGENVFDPETSRCVPLSEASCRNPLTTLSTNLQSTLTTTQQSTSSSTSMTTQSSTSSTTSSVSITTETSHPTDTQQTTTSSTTWTTPDGGISFTCPSDNGFFPFPNACTSEYIICVSGAPYLGVCPGGAIFDPVTLICTSAGQASCGEFKCPAPNGFFPIPGACSNNYYSCIADVPYLENCPGDSIFDPASEICVPAHSATCLTTVPTIFTKPISSSTPTIASFTCTASGNFPYPGSCSLYYVCTLSSTSYIIESCSSDKVFNPDTQWCELSVNVPSCEFNLMDNLKDVTFAKQTLGKPCPSPALIS